MDLEGTKHFFNGVKSMNQLIIFKLDLQYDSLLYSKETITSAMITPIIFQKDYNR